VANRRARITQEGETRELDMPDRVSDREVRNLAEKRKKEEKERGGGGGEGCIGDNDEKNPARMRARGIVNPRKRRKSATADNAPRVGSAMINAWISETAVWRGQ